MNSGYLRYDKMVKKALRGVVRDALEEVAAQGLPGDHHFYISFLTHHPGVRVPDYLRAQYKREMTIVLQYQFFDLTAAPDFFSVMLSFGGISERLVIPYEAITTFADPAVNFALQFQPADESVPELDEGDAEDEANEPPRVATATIKPALVREEASEQAEPAKVVTLDAFRKKT